MPEANLMELIKQLEVSDMRKTASREKSAKTEPRQQTSDAIDETEKANFRANIEATIERWKQLQRIAGKNDTQEYLAALLNKSEATLSRWKGTNPIKRTNRGPTVKLCRWAGVIHESLWESKLRTCKPIPYDPSQATLDEKIQFLKQTGKWPALERQIEQSYADAIRSSS